jgi:glyoxylase-like metal-dependent hydrolase (beta-lactamase superfamily II)
MPDLIRVSRYGLMNAYLVREDDGLTLVDTAMGAAKPLLAAAEEAGAPIVRIALTHAHGDHIGSVDALKEQLPEAEVIISTRDARLMAKDKSLDPDEPADKIRGSLPGARTTPTRTVEDGDRIGSLQAVATPGHTPGHFAFVDTRDGTLICGDVFTTFGRVETTAKFNPRFPFATTATWHKPTEVQSAQRLIDLDPSRLAPGHGPIVEGPGDAMRAAVARAS